MRKNALKYAGGLIALIALAFLVAGSCSAAEFSADVIQKGRGEILSGKLYVKAAKVRKEIVSGGRKEIVIYRPDQKAVLLLYPGRKTYMTVSDRIISGLDDPSARARLKKISTVKHLGNEKINGYVCARTQWVTRGTSPLTLTEWYSKKLDRVIKIEMKTRFETSLIECRNIKEGGVSSTLFDLPRGYKKIATPTPPPPDQR